MFPSIFFSLASLVFFIFLAMLLYATWIAHKTTQMERVPVSGHPSKMDIEWEDVVFSSRSDAISLSGWYLPAANDDRCIILVQGTGQNRNDPAIRALQIGRDLVTQGFSVLLFDLRARGQSSGIRSSEGDREQWDLFGAIDYVHKHRGLPVERIGLLGFSLGAGVAILVAGQESRIPAVVSDSGFLDYMMDLRRFSIGPFPIPFWFTFLVAWAGRVFFKADFSNVRPARAISEIVQPIFFIHGQGDRVVPAEESKELYMESNNKKDQIWIVPGARHVSVYRTMPEAYIQKVSNFFRRYIK
jgi:uncharacterized protein